MTTRFPFAIAVCVATTVSIAASRQNGTNLRFARGPTTVVAAPPTTDTRKSVPPTMPANGRPDRRIVVGSSGRRTTTGDVADSAQQRKRAKHAETETETRAPVEEDHVEPKRVPTLEHVVRIPVRNQTDRRAQATGCPDGKVRSSDGCADPFPDFD